LVYDTYLSGGFEAEANATSVAKSCPLFGRKSLLAIEENCGLFLECALVLQLIFEFKTAHHNGDGAMKK
jgi:hypothetical protein